MISATLQHSNPISWSRWARRPLPQSECCCSALAQQAALLHPHRSPRRRAAERQRRVPVARRPARASPSGQTEPPAPAQMRRVLLFRKESHTIFVRLMSLTYYDARDSANITARWGSIALKCRTLWTTAVAPRRQQRRASQSRPGGRSPSPAVGARRPDHAQQAAPLPSPAGARVGGRQSGSGAFPSPVAPPARPPAGKQNPPHRPRCGGFCSSGRSLMRFLSVSCLSPITTHETPLILQANKNGPV